MPREIAYELTDPIETERLLLRRFEPGDLEALSYRSDPTVVRYLYWDVQTEDQVREALDAKIAATAIQTEGDFIALAAILKDSGVMVGDLILQMVSQEHGQGEVGFIMDPAHHGKGFATEATREMLRLAFEDIGLHRVVGRAEARNVASARVLEKAGMRMEAHLVENEWVKGEWQSELVFAMLEREWRDAPPAIDARHDQTADRG